MQDTSVLVQRSALDFLLIGFPIHNSQLTHQDMILLIKAALVTILRRDMSLNRYRKLHYVNNSIRIFVTHFFIRVICRRLFAWLLGTEVSTSILKKKNNANVDAKEDSVTYFDIYSKEMLVEAIKHLLKEVCEENSQDLKPYRILVSLLDKIDIGPVILDDILFEVFR